MGLIKKTNKNRVYLLGKGLVRAQMLRAWFYVFASMIGLASLVFANLASPWVRASTPYNASAVLGQNNFNTAYVNNIKAPNSSGFNGDYAVALDSAHHRLFVSDQSNNRVLVFLLDSHDNIDSYEASYVLGQPDFSNYNPDATQTVLNQPYGLAYDSTDNRLFVSDNQNSRVLVYDLSGGITNGMDASYVLGQGGFTSSSACSTPAANCLSYPEGLSYDTTAKRLFVADTSNSRVLVYDLSGGITNGMDASYVLGQSGFDGSNCTGTPSANILCGVTDLDIDSTSQELFVTDQGGNRVLVYDLSSGISDGMDASYVLGQSDFTSEDYGPSSNTLSDGGLFLTYDSDHKRLFVGDLGSYRILVFDLSSGITNGMDASYVLGQSDFTSSAFISPTASTVLPLGLAYNPTSDSLFAADDEERVLEFNLSQGVTNDMDASYVLGQTSGGQPSFETEMQDNANASASGLDGPEDTITDSVRHWLFVADGNDRVLVYKLDSQNHISSQTASWVLGEPDFLTNPNSCTNTIGSSDICSASALAYDANTETLFVADSRNNRVLVFKLAHGISNYMSASYELGEPDFSTLNGGTTKNLLSTPFGLAYDPINKRLFVSDWVDSRVLVYDLSGGITNGMDASYVLGQSDFTSSSACSTVNASCLSYPYGLNYDSANQRLFVVDGNNNRVLVYDLSGGISDGMDASYVLGQGDFGSNSSRDGQASMSEPYGISYSSKQKKLFVADSGNNRVLIYDLSGSISNGMAAAGVLGQANFTDDNTAASQSGFYAEANMSYNDSTNQLFVADAYNNRVLEFDFARLAGSLATGTTGEHYQVNLGSQTQGTTTYKLISGSLPAGLKLNRATGVLVGTPTDAGTYKFSISLSDANGLAGTYSDSASYSLVINTPATVSSSVAIGPSSSNSSTTTSQKSTALIDLNNFGYDTSTGYSFNVGVGQKTKFELTTSLGSLEDHTLTINSINQGDVNFTLASSPQTFDLAAGQSTEADLDGDNQADVSVMVDSIQAKTAELTLWRIANATTPPAITSSASQTPGSASRVKWYELSASGVVLFIVLLAFSRRRRSSQLGVQPSAEPTIITPSNPVINLPAQPSQRLSPMPEPPLPPVQTPAPTFTQPSTPSPVPQPRPVPAAPVAYQPRPSINLASNNIASNSFGYQQPNNRSNLSD